CMSLLKQTMLLVSLSALPLWCQTYGEISGTVRDPSRGAYAVQPFGTFGNAGRNTVIGPGIVGWESSAQKNFRVAEKNSLQFRLEAFNFPNHPNWGDPGNLVSVNGFGTITTTRTDMRDLQLALKFIF